MKLNYKTNIIIGFALIMLQSFNLFFLENLEQKKLFSNILQVLAALYSFLNLHFTSIHLNKNKIEKQHGWFFVSIASFFWFIGALTFMIVEIFVTAKPYPSIPDYFFISFYIVIFWGIFKIPKPKLQGEEKRGGYIDLITMIISTLAILWNFIYVYLVDKLFILANPALLMSLVYTVLDTVLLIMIYYLLITRILYGKNLFPYLLLLLGVLFLIISDFLQAVISSQTDFTSGSIADLGWVIFPVISAFGGIYKKKIGNELNILDKSNKKADLKKNILVLVITYLCLGLSISALIFGISNNNLNYQNNLLLIISIIVVFGLVLFRQILLIKSNNELNSELLVTTELLEESNIELKQLNEEISKESQKLIKLNDILIKSENELKIANETKNKFFSIIAHDLKNPIGAFHNLVELLSSRFEKLSKEESIKIISAIKESSYFTLELLNNLLNWARSQRGRIEYYPIITNIYDLVNSIINQLKTQADNKSIIIKNQIKQDILLNLDPNLIKIVVRNLLSNSIKFSFENSEINITANIQNDECYILIEDNGIGMDDYILNNLFKLDVKVVEQGTKQEKGTGLGLLICKEFVEIHKGRIIVESKKNVGSKFTIILPV